MTFPSSVETMPRLRALFSSRFVVVETGQSPSAGPAVELSGAGGAGVGGGASDKPLLDVLGEALEAAPLVVALAARVRFLFFTIVRSEGGLKSRGGAAVVSKEEETRKKGCKKKAWKG
jgi:hypothetical protein